MHGAAPVQNIRTVAAAEPKDQQNQEYPATAPVATIVHAVATRTEAENGTIANNAVRPTGANNENFQKLQDGIFDQLKSPQDEFVGFGNLFEDLEEKEDAEDDEGTKDDEEAVKRKITAYKPPPQSPIGIELGECGFV